MLPRAAHLLDTQFNQSTVSATLMHIQRILFGAFLTAFLSLVFFTGLAYKNLIDSYAHQKKEDTSLKVLMASEKLYTGLQDVEEGITTFAITRNDKALAQYRRGISLCAQNLKELQQAEITNSEERAHIQKLSSQVRALFSASSPLVAVTKSGNPLLLSEVHTSLDSINAQIQAIEDIERNSIHLSDYDSQSSREKMLTIFVAFSGFMVLFFISTYLFIYKSLVNRNKVAQSIKEKEQLYSNLFFKSPTMLALIEASSGKIIDANEYTLQFFGNIREQVIGNSIRSLIDFIDPDSRKAMLKQLAQQHTVKDFETQVRTADGSIKYISYNINKIFLQNQDCLLLAFEDITERKMAEEQLKISESLFSTIFYKSPIMNSISEVETGLLLDVNDNYPTFYGYKKEEIIGKTSIDLHMWDNAEERKHYVEELRKSGAMQAVEVKVRTRSGELKYISVHADLITIDGQECLLSAFIDITEQKEAEQLVRNLNLSLEKSISERIKEITDYKYALDQSSIVDITDKTGRIQYANDNFCHISGYSREELIGQSHRISNAGYHTKEFFQEMRKTISDGHIWKGEIRNKSKNGTCYWTETTIVPLLDDNNLPHQYLAISMDITAQKNSEEKLLSTVEQLEKSESILKEAQALAHLGSWEYDLKTKKGIWSDEFYKILGTSPSEVKPTPINLLTFVHPEDTTKIEQVLQSIELGSNMSYQHDCRIIRKDGSIRYLYNEFKVKLSPEGKPHTIMGISHDVTSKHLVQLEKERITSDLLQRNKDLEQFAYIVSHNLRAPVANIMGLSHLIQKTAPGTEGFCKSMKGLITSVDKLDAVVADLNHVLQVRQEVNQKKEVVDLNQLISDIKSMHATLLDKEEAVIFTDFSELNQLFSIKSYLHSIFSNLITNSIKYRQAHQPPVINISTSIAPGKVIIQYKDNGIGIDLSANQNKVFGLYKRFHFHTDGKGMGLFMVKTQVESMGGRIHIRSEVNEGTEFVIELDEQTEARN